MKICTKCGIKSDNFGPDKRNKNGLNSWCRVCVNIKTKNYVRTKEGLVAKIYKTQTNSSKRRGHKLPEYTLNELRRWVFSKPNFEELYSNWVNSGYEIMLIPSCDRLDDNKPYTFDNIQLMTWAENKTKGHKDMREGRLIHGNKPQRAVTGINKNTGEKIEFHSMNEAQRVTGVSHSNISNCCRGVDLTGGGYIWQYS